MERRVVLSKITEDLCEKLISTQLFGKLSTFYASLPCSHEFAIDPYPEPYLFSLHLPTILSRFRGVTKDGVWIGGWTYWPLTHTTRNYKELQRHRWSPQFTNHYSTRFALSSMLTSPAVPWQRLLTVEILQFQVLRVYVHSLPYRTQLSASLAELIWTHSSNFPGYNF
jgi:hypothetical protein